MIYLCPRYRKFGFSTKCTLSASIVFLFLTTYSFSLLVCYKYTKRIILLHNIGCRKRAKASVLTIYFLVRFCYYTPINSLSQLSQKKHITSPCKHVEQHHIWGDKTRAAYMRFGYVIDKRNHLCLRLINVTYSFQHRQGKVSQGTCGVRMARETEIYSWISTQNF